MAKIPGSYLTHLNEMLKYNRSFDRAARLLLVFCFSCAALQLHILFTSSSMAGKAGGTVGFIVNVVIFWLIYKRTKKDKRNAQALEQSILRVAREVKPEGHLYVWGLKAS